MLRNFGLDPWIIEATNIQHSFYEELTKKICYPQKNNLSFKNIGVNEALSLKHSLHCLPFSDDDMIVKITGRYVLYDSFLIDLIKTNTGFDSYIKWMDNQVFTGCFALKWKHFKKFINNLDMKQMEKNMINLEQKLAEFIIKENLLYYPLDKLHIKARIYGNGQGNITYDL